MTKFVPTICLYCGTGCGILLVVKDGTVVGVEPWLKHPVSQGQLCAKGWNAYEFVHHRDRLLKPLIKDNGSFREATWSEALKLVASKFKEVVGNYGPDAVALFSSAKCTNEENYLMQKLARAVLGTNNIDHCARLCHAPSVTGLGAAFGSGAMTNSMSDIAEADVILIIGSDTTSQHPLVAKRIVQAKERGARLIVADPRHIQLASLADIYLPQKPGTDVALLNGMIKVIIDQGLEDREFIEQRTEGFGDLVKVIKDYPLVEVEKITGVPAKDIEQAAVMFARAQGGVVVYGMGITQHTTGTDNVMSIANLAMLTGNVGKQGNGVSPLRGHNNVQGSCDMGALPDVYPGYQKVADPTVRAEFESAWGVFLPAAPGLTLTEITNAAYQRRIKMLYIMGENPVLSEPCVRHVQGALEELDFLVVQDLFLNETAQLADVVLPATSFAEKEGTFTNTERRVQLLRKAIEPLGNSLPDWKILCELAKEMGAGRLFPFSSPGEVFEEMRKLTHIYSGITYKRLNQPRGLQWPCPDETHPGTPILHLQQFTRGKGKFFPVHFRAPAEEPDEEYPYMFTTGRVTFQWHTRTLTSRSPSLDAEVPQGYVEISPRDAAKLNIVDGETVKVSSRRGEIQTKALITARVQEGLLCMPFHFADSAANTLTSREVDPVAKIPEFKICAVRIQPAR